MADSIVSILHQFAIEMRQLGDHLPPYQSGLGEENVAYVRDTSTTLVDELEKMAAETGNPLESKDVRHDVRNRIAVIKGFADLMLMDVDESHVVMPSLKALTTISDKFCAELDGIKSSKPDEENIFAG